MKGRLYFISNVFLRKQKCAVQITHIGDIELKHSSKERHSNDCDQGNTAVNHDINCNMLATVICQRE